MVYVAILLALLVGTALTVWASFLELGPWNPIIALAIATAKATLVVLFFMHGKVQHQADQTHRRRRHLHVLILVSMTLADYISRAWEAGRRGWRFLAEGLLDGAAWE